MVTLPGANEIYFQVDDAWPAGIGGVETIDVRNEARALRFISTPKQMEAFAVEHASQMRPYTLFGSGDFHHLTAVWTRQFRDSFLLLSFDNHPDWVTSGPRWSCGAWVHRALENPRVRGVAVWGCGAGDCEGRNRGAGARPAAAAGRLAVHPWRRPRAVYPEWLSPVTRETWRADLAEWAKRHAGEKLYITIDLDALANTDAATNWEAGAFTVEDLAWALGVLREKMTVIGGDLCGAWSTPRFAGTFQRFASWWDHPKALPLPASHRSINEAARNRLWPALTGRA